MHAGHYAFEQMHVRVILITNVIRYPTMKHPFCDHPHRSHRPNSRFQKRMKHQSRQTSRHPEHPRYPAEDELGHTHPRARQRDIRLPCCRRPRDHRPPKEVKYLWLDGGMVHRWRWVVHDDEGLT
jgi:hypothetical protein